MTATEGPLRLWTYFRSSASWRVRAALGLKGLSWESVPVHLTRDGGEQWRDAYRAVNPMREVPALAIDGAFLAQSLAILEYLEETRPSPPLYPGTAAERARVRQICEIVNASIQPLQNLRVLRYLESELGADEATRKKWCGHWIAFGFDGLEPIVAGTAGRFAFGDSVGAADCCIVPQVYNAGRFGVDMDAWPTLARVAGAAEALPAFRAAHAHAQPDTPAELRAQGG